MDEEKIRELLKNMERIAKSAQDYARSLIDKEPSQRTQNNYWRYLLQDIRDLKKEIGIE